jgi:hypothetical protein
MLFPNRVRGLIYVCMLDSGAVGHATDLLVQLWLAAQRDPGDPEVRSSHGIAAIWALPRPPTHPQTP